MSDTFSLQDLERIIRHRASATAESSYTRSLLEKGAERCAQKLGEEAVETVIASTKNSRWEVITESADLLYHLLVLLRAHDVDLDEVLDELQNRTQQSGLAEKTSRKTSS